MIRYFLAKSEPSSYSILDLEKEGETWWDGVHNFQAINVIKSLRIGDLVFFYQSVTNPSIVGLMEVSSTPEKDLLDKRKISWKAKMIYKETFVEPLSLKEIKTNPKFKDFILVRNSRLSFMACTQDFVDFVFKNTDKKSN
jgi:predicted RNA-binding protein with PUA-like domain